MTREEAHKFIDQLFDVSEGPAPEGPINVDNAARELGVALEETRPEEPARVLPEGKRVVRTKNSGDRVHLLDETKKTRQWITKPEVLESLGFQLGDVVEVEEEEFLGYQMGPALYQPVK